MGGQLQINAARHVVTGGATVDMVLPTLPSPDNINNFLELNFHDEDLIPMAGAPYRVVFENGTTKEGKLDDKGYARLENIPEGKASVYYGENPRPYKKHVPKDVNADINVEDDTDEDLWSLLDEKALSETQAQLQKG